MLVDPVPAGTTAQVAISAQFPAGTPVGHAGGEPGHDQRVQRLAGHLQPGDRHGQGRVEVDGDQERRAPGTPPQVDTPYTYKVGITLAAGGTQNLNGVVFTDTLPAGAQFVSATGGGTRSPTGS